MHSVEQQRQNLLGERVQESDSGVDVILEFVVVHVELEEEFVVELLLLLPFALMNSDGESVAKDVAHGIGRSDHQLDHARLQVVLQWQTVDQVPGKGREY